MNDESRAAALARLAELKQLIPEAKRHLLALQEEERQVNQYLYTPPLPQFRTDLPPIPTPEQIREATKREVGFEIDFGRWLARIGVLFALITIISFSAIFFTMVGPLAKVALLTVVSALMFWGGSELERRDPKVVVFARTLAGGGLACLYFTLYGATNLDSLRVIDSPFLGGVLLLVWSGFVLYLGEKKQSELLSFFSIALAYFSSAINPSNNFMLGADLLLAATSVALLIRNSWLSLSYFCLIATYIGLFASIIQYNSDGDLKPIIVQFWPCIAYLMGAWVIHNVGLYSVTKSHAKDRRVPYLCLNNGGLVFLMLISAKLSTFGHYDLIFFTLGCLFSGMAVATGRVLPACSAVAGCYLFQGILLVTAALVDHFTGQTRAILLIGEMLLLVAAGTYSGNWALRALGYVVTFLAMDGLLIQIGDHPDSLLLLASGFIAILVCGYIARQKKSETSGQAIFFVIAASIFLGIGASIYGNQTPILSERTEIALAYLGYLLTVFAGSLFYPELALGGQLLIFFTAIATLGDTSTVANMARVHVSLVLNLTAFFFMRRPPTLEFPILKRVLVPLACVYAVLSVLLYNAITDTAADLETNAFLAALGSVSFLVFWGRLFGAWPLALAGQFLLAKSVFQVLSHGDSHWNGLEGFVIAIVLGTAWVFEYWTKLDPVDFGLPAFASLSQAFPDPIAKLIPPLAVGYKSIAVVLVAKLLDSNLSPDQLPLAMFALGLILLIAGEFIPFDAVALCALTADALAFPNYLASNHTSGLIWHLACLGMLTAQVAILAKTKTPRRWALMGINFITCFSTMAYIGDWSDAHLPSLEKIPVYCLGAVLLSAMGLWARLIQPIVTGQILLLVGLVLFIQGGYLSASEALLTVPAWLSVFTMGWMLKLLSTKNWEEPIRNISRVYRLAGILLLALWTSRAFPEWAVCALLMYVGTSISLVNLLLRNLFGARCGLVLGAIGVVFYVVHRIQNEGWVELADGIGFACLILQSTVFRFLAGDMVTTEERNAIVGFTCLSGWLFVGNAFPWPHYATMVWAIYAVGITAMGFTFNERAQRVIGLCILVVAMIRVGFVDFWEFPGLLKVFTFFALTIGCLSLSYLYHRFGERMKEWL